FFFTIPAKKPRTECGCHPVTFEIAAMVVPPLAWSRPRTRSCLVARPLERDAVCVLFFVFDLSCFAGLVRGLGVLLDLAIKDLRGGRHYRRTTWSGISEGSGARPRWKYNGAPAAPAITTTAAPIAMRRVLHLLRRSAAGALRGCRVGLAGRIASSRTTW